MRKKATGRVVPSPHAGAAGTETLKNLVLGGIAAYTVVDNGDLGTRDMGNNFMADELSLGMRRAAAVAATLQELNDNVSASCVDEDPAAILEKRPEFFQTFTLVIATEAR